MEKVEGIQYWVVVEFCFSHSHNLSEMNSSVKLAMDYGVFAKKCP